MEEEYNSDEEYEEFEESEETVKLNNLEEISNVEISKENKEYSYFPEKCFPSNLVPRRFDDFSLIERKFNTICKILNGKNAGIGFFCKIIINGRTVKALFTSYNVLDEKKIKIGYQLEVFYNNSIVNLKITKNRFVFSSKQFGYFCIEILPEDNINNFLQVERNIYDEINGELSIESLINEYKFHKLVLIQYKLFSENSKYKYSISTGNLKDFRRSKRIFYAIPVYYGSKGAPILSMNSSLDVIGIHTHYLNKKKRIMYNNGILFNNIICDIQKKFNSK